MNKLAIQITALKLLTSTAAFSQGGTIMPPPGAPAPTMRSLQEIWDKLDGLEARVAASKDSCFLLHYATGGSLPWVVQNVGDIAGHQIMHVSLAFGPNGQPGVTFYDDTPGSVFSLFRFNGSIWTSTKIDSEDFVGGWSSLAFGPSGYPSVAYSDPTNDQLKYATFDGNDWQLTAVNGLGVGGRDTSLAFGPDGHPAISYWDGMDLSHDKNLRFARFNGAVWSDIAVDDEDFTGEFTSLAFGPDGQPAISYYDATNTALKFARYDGDIWSIDLIDSIGNVGQYTSMAFGPDGLPAIAYRGLDTRLKLIRMGVFKPGS